MPATPLTDLAIRKLTPTAGRQVDVYDAVVRGLVLRVSPSGTKTFVVWYRIGGKARRLTLGVKRHATLTPNRRPILTPRSREVFNG